MLRHLTPALLVVATAVGCGDDSSTDQPGPTRTQGQAASQLVGETVNVEVVDTDYEPRDAEVNLGQEVVWTNTGAVAHTVTAANESDFDSGTMKPGERFAFTPDSSGKITYFCKIHPNQRGSLQISE